MTAIVTHRLLRPRAGSAAAGFFSTPSMRRHPGELFETLKAIWSVTSQGLLLLSMLAVVALSSLIAAGAMGLLE